MTVYITYDNEELTDGLGAQTLRIIGIYAIAKKYRINYLHSPIKETIEEFAHGVSNEDTLVSLMHQMNHLFYLPSSTERVVFDLEIRIRNLGLRSLMNLMVRYKFSRKAVLLRVCLPFGITDRKPSIYKIAIEFIKAKNVEFFSQKRQGSMVLHFRMGHGQIAPVANHVKPKLLPLEYFLNVLEKISSKASILGIEKLIIHTDLSDSERLWKPSPKRLEQNISQGEEIIDGQVRVPKSDVSKMFAGVENLNLEVKYCADFFETFKDMVNAEVLIISRSAFSYLAALFNTNLVIYPSGHGHARFGSWTSSDELGVPRDFKLLPW